MIHKFLFDVHNKKFLLYVYILYIYILQSSAKPVSMVYCNTASFMVTMETQTRRSHYKSTLTVPDIVLTRLASGRYKLGTPSWILLVARFHGTGSLYCTTGK